MGDTLGFLQARLDNAPFKWSDVGVAEGEMNSENEFPSLSILVPSAWRQLSHEASRRIVSSHPTS